MSKSLTAGCGCGKNKTYVVKDKGGKVTKRTKSLQEAITLARKVGGSYARA